jgi:tetratricopeptide (TPR) repeat protein
VRSRRKSSFRRSGQGVPSRTPKQFGGTASSRLNDLEVLANRGQRLMHEALMAHDMAALEAAIAAFEHLVGALPAGHINRAGMLSNLGSVLLTRHEWTGQPDDMDRAVEIGEQAVAIVGADHPDRARMLSNLRNALFNRYARTKQMVDLGRFVEVSEQAVFVAGADHPERAVYLSNLGKALAVRYERTGQLADLDQAVDVAARAVAANVNDSNRAARLYELGDYLGDRYGITRQVGDLDQFVAVSEQAVAATRVNAPELANHLFAHGVALFARYRRTGQLTDLDGAVAVSEQAVAASADHPDSARYLSRLGVALCARFGRTGRRADVDRAVAVGEKAVAATVADDPDRAGYLSNLGVALNTRCEQTSQLADLDRAIGFSEQAVAAADAEHPRRATYVFNLGSALHTRYWWTGQFEDLDRAIEVSQQAVEATGTDHPDRAEMLTGLGVVLCTRYRRTGQFEDLDRAVDVGEQSVVAEIEHLDNPLFLSNLGSTLLARYRLSGRLGDLDRAVDVGERAVVAAGASDPQRGNYLCALGGALVTRFGRTGQLGDLDRAVEVTDQAVAGPGVNDLNRAPIVASLGLTLFTRYLQTGQLGDLDRAVEVCGHAAAAAAADRPDRALYMANHASVLLTRFDRTGQLGDLNRAVEVGELAVTAAGDDDPRRASSMQCLGDALDTRSLRTGHPTDLERAEEMFRAASQVVSAPPIDRARSATSWAMAAQGHDWGQAAEGYTQAVELLGQVAPRWLGRDDQEHWLGEFVGIGRDAVAACLQAGLPERAAELFEQGRGVLFAQVLDYRTAVSALADVHPELAQEFVQLTRELDRDDTSPAGQTLVLGNTGARTDPPGEAGRRQRTGASLQTLLGVIRSQAGFEKFMQRNPIGELLPAAGDGLVVLINVAKARSDALILSSTGVDVVPLPCLDFDTAVDQTNTFLPGLGDALDGGDDRTRREVGETALSEVLGWLWDTVAGPVLDHLGLTSKPNKDQPWVHVHWCPSGPLTFLPLHAAGHHETRFDQSPATVIDRVISSTIPTVRALANARRRDTSPNLVGGPDGHRVLVVAMPETPGQPALPGADREAKLICDLLPASVEVLGLPGTPSATHDSVTAALPTHAWVHFSCHGANDPRIPSASHVLLEDYQSHPLTVLDLTRARLRDVEFAFLSACATALNGTSLPDESIHLAAAFQFAGYRHVIATLWPVRDDDAVTVTQIVYEHITADGGNSRADTAAAALHAATRILRANFLQEPSRWAAHTHTGP